jgi:hypothetical protein
VDDRRLPRRDAPREHEDRDSGRVDAPEVAGGEAGRDAGAVDLFIQNGLPLDKRAMGQFLKDMQVGGRSGSLSSTRAMSSRSTRRTGCCRRAVASDQLL